MTAEAVGSKVATIRRAAGNRSELPELNILAQSVSITDRATAGPPPSPFYLAGTVDDVAAQVQAARTRYGISYVAVFERYLTAFAPIVARLAGQ